MKQQFKHSQSPVCRILAFVLVAVLLLGCMAISAVADGPVTITRLEWQNADDLVFGEANQVSVVAYDENDNAYDDVYAVKYPAGYGQANTEYTLTAVLSDTSFAEASTLVHTKNVTIAPKEYGVTFANKTVAGDGSTPYNITVTGVDANGAEMPFDLRAVITYKVNGNVFSGTAAPGVYNITATLPVGNYKFYAAGAEVSELNATLTINRQKEIVSVMKDGESQFVVFLSADLATDGTQVGLGETVTATATFAEGLKAPEGTKNAQSFQIQINGAAENDTFTLLIPITQEVLKAGCQDINPKTSVYVYDKNGTPVTAASQGYAVSVSQGAVKISGVSATGGSLTVSIAPQYKSGGLPWGWIVAIIVIVFVLLLIAFFFIGRKVDKNLRERIKQSKKAPAPEPEPEPVEEKEDDESVPTIAVVDVPAEEEPDTDPTQPAMRGLVYIDVVKKPEEYGRMLMKEEAGEGVVVYRYRKSYLAKLALADGKIGEYYSIVKNALLRFHGVKARKSWNYEAFNQGRNQIAKIIPNGKTLYLYLSIDPKTLEGTKYGAIDVSEKKKFEATPSLMKVRGDRKLKFALELIEKICGEQLALKPLDKPDEDYKPANQTAEKLFDSGLIRKMAALAPIPNEEKADEQSNA